MYERLWPFAQVCSHIHSHTHESYIQLVVFRTLPNLIKCSTVWRQQEAHDDDCFVSCRACRRALISLCFLVQNVMTMLVRIVL